MEPNPQSKEMCNQIHKSLEEKLDCITAKIDHQTNVFEEFKNNHFQHLKDDVASLGTRIAVIDEKLRDKNAPSYRWEKLIEKLIWALLAGFIGIQTFKQFGVI